MNITNNITKDNCARVESSEVGELLPFAVSPDSFICQLLPYASPPYMILKVLKGSERSGLDSREPLDCISVERPLSGIFLVSGGTVN